MKKSLIILALLTLCLGANAQKKDKKGAKAVATIAAPAQEMVNIKTPADSISYAAGQAFTRGLMDYLKQQFNITDAEMPFFMEGLKHGLSMGDDAQSKARAAGEQIASMATNNMLPQLVQQMDGTGCDVNTALFKRGFLDAVSNDASVLSVEESAKYFEGKQKELKEIKQKALAAEGKAFLEENAKKEDVVTLPSGLQYKVLVKGDGPIAKADQDVTVRYEGKLINGKVFDSSYTRTPDTTTFKPTQVIKGWTEALTLMPQGSTWELYIPYDLAYGERGAGANIPPFATLIFKVEVVEVK